MTQPLHSSLQGSLLECHDDCDVTAPGHALSLIQERLASATPSKWADAVVLSVSKAGWIEVAVLSDDSALILWNHDGLTDSLQVGDPVAVHSVYDVLAVSDAKYNVLRAGSL
ncbi:MAG: hypothetical protein ABI130_14595 [Leifsonia sp.]